MRLCMRRVFAHRTSLQPALGGASRAAQLLFPFFIKCDEDCGELLAGSLPIQTERKAPWTHGTAAVRAVCPLVARGRVEDWPHAAQVQPIRPRSEEHTSELQSLRHL